MHRKQLFIALLLLALLSAAAGRHSSAPLPAAGTAAGHAAAGERMQTGEITAAARLDGNGGQTETEGGTATGEFANAGEADPTAVDTVIVVDKVQVTAIKQGMVLRSQPVAAAIVGSRAIERGHVDALKNLSQNVPNFYVPDYGSRMTSSIYVRGLGARIDQPVMGLNIDNVPVLNKDNYDMELADAERIEVLRGPQSTLYGRNTMGGVINIYNFLSDSFKFNRNADEGYLIGRIFINRERRYFVEGKRQTSLRAMDFGRDEIDREALIPVLESAIAFSLEFDLLMPPYEGNKRVTVDQFNTKMDNSKFVTGKRLGYDFDVEDI